jgi:membrane protease YdiL (CAAX protease family)
MTAGDIEPPPRADRAGSAAVLTILTAYAATGPLPQPDQVMVVVVLIVATLAAIAVRCPYAVHAGVLTIVYLVVLSSSRIAVLWPLPLVIILGVYGAVARSVPWLRESSGWLKRGHIDRTSWAMMGGFVAASATALVVWRYWTSTDMAIFRPYVPNVPNVPIALWPIGLVAIAALNAAFEEIIWRGVLLYAVESAVGPGWIAWLLQGIGFGIWHYQGFPHGWVGVGLATIFALMMGALRIRSKGMLAPFIAHVFADVTIFTLVAAMVLAK